MFSKQIAETIHFFIRKNNLKNIISLLVSKTNKKNKIATLGEKIEKFLVSQNDIYDWKQAKYIHFLENISNSQSSTMTFDVYSIPEKNNNLFLVFLMYFYLKNNQKGNEKILFDTIYTYFLVILYRNKLSLENREKMITLKNKSYQTFMTFGENIKNWKLKIISELLAIISVVSFFFLDLKFIQSNVLFDNSSNISHLIYSSLFFDNIDGMFGTLKIDFSDFDAKSFLGVFLVFALIGYMKEFIKSTFLQNIFGFFIKSIKVIFDVLKYFISVTTNIMIWQLMKIYASAKYNFLGIYLLIFLVLYITIYFVSILFYILLFTHIFSIDFIAVYALSGLITLILLYTNFYSGLLNFEKFLITIDTHMNTTKKAE